MSQSVNDKPTEAVYSEKDCEKGMRYTAVIKVETDGIPDFPLQMAAVTVGSIPLFLVFVFLRKYIMKGVSRSGIKG